MGQGPYSDFTPGWYQDVGTSLLITMAILSSSSTIVNLIFYAKKRCGRACSKFGTQTQVRVLRGAGAMCVAGNGKRGALYCMCVCLCLRLCLRLYLPYIGRLIGSVHRFLSTYSK